MHTHAQPEGEGCGSKWVCWIAEQDSSKQEVISSSQQHRHSSSSITPLPPRYHILQLTEYGVYNSSIYIFVPSYNITCRSACWRNFPRFFAIQLQVHLPQAVTRLDAGVSSSRHRRWAGGAFAYQRAKSFFFCSRFVCKRKNILIIQWCRIRVLLSQRP